MIEKLIKSVLPNGRRGSSVKRTKRIRILYIIDWLHEFGGTEKHLHQLVKYLDPEQFSCYLIALNGNPAFIHQFFSVYGCRYEPITLNRIYTLPALLKAWQIYRFIRDEGIDIVQTFGMSADNYASIIARLSRHPVVISSRRDMGTYRTGLYALADRISKHFIHQYISVCDRLSAKMVSGGIDASVITRLYNGIELNKWLKVKPGANPELRKKLGVPQDSFVIGNVSHFRPEKGHEKFFEAISHFVRKVPNTMVFALGGQDEQFYRIQQKVAADEHLRNRVVITHTREIADYLSIFDVACLTPVSNEGFSNAILEEMACGLPIIATDVGGNAEAVVDGVTGYIIPPGDVDALETALLKLYQAPKLRQSMGHNARQRAIHFFDLRTMINNYQSYYLRLYLNKNTPAERRK